MSIKDFRASQIQTSQIISSGSSSTNAKLVIYDIKAQDQANLNLGLIDSTTFNTNNIGTDTFVYVSGGVGGIGISGGDITTFGGDIYVSGVVKSFISGTTLQNTYDAGNVINVDAAAAGKSLILSGNGQNANDPILELVDNSSRTSTAMIRMQRKWNNNQNSYYLQGLLADGTETLRVQQNGSFTSQFLARQTATSIGVTFSFLNEIGTGMGLEGGANPSLTFVVLNSSRKFLFHANGVGSLFEINPAGNMFTRSYINSYFDKPTFVSSSLFVKEGFVLDPSPSKTSASYGADVNFVVSGVAGGRGTVGDSTGLFLGDLHVSGNLTVDGTGLSGGGADFDWVDLGGTLKTTSSVAISGDGNQVSNIGTDVYFYVSGTKAEAFIAPVNDKRTVFGSDTVISGALSVMQGMLLTSASTDLSNDFQLFGSGETNRVLGLQHGSEFTFRNYGNTAWGNFLRIGANPVISSMKDSLLLGDNVSISSSILVATSGGIRSDAIVLDPYNGSYITADNFAIDSGFAGARGHGSDVFLYISGTVTTGSSTDKVSVFGGSVHVSGNIYTDGSIQSLTTTVVETATTRSLTDFDNDKIILGSSLTDIKIIVPTTLTPGVSVVLMVDQSGGQMVVSGATGITLEAKLSATTPLSTFEAWSPITITMRTPTLAFVYGDLA